jgi:Zn-dependent M16 (insulinase) family peptidase
VYFDLTGMEREDIEYLMLYLSMIQETGTDRYSAGEIELLMAEYLYDFKTSLVYPNEVSGDHHRPMLMVE